MIQTTIQFGHFCDAFRFLPPADDYEFISQEDWLIISNGEDDQPKIAIPAMHGEEAEFELSADSVKLLLQYPLCGEVCLTIDDEGGTVEFSHNMWLN